MHIPKQQCFHLDLSWNINCRQILDKVQSVSGLYHVLSNLSTRVEVNFIVITSIEYF